MSQLKLVHRYEVDMRSDLTGNPGEFNGSTQHQFEIYLQDFEGLDSFAATDSKETKPCLGLIEYRPGQRFFVKELWAQSIKEGVASTV